MSRLSFVVVVGLVGIVGFAYPETVFAGEADPSPTITIPVNNTQASSAVLAEAEREAGRIFHEAGLQVLWLECPVVQSSADTQGPCQKAPEATDIRLRILSAPVLDKFQNSVFGFAVHPVLASVYYEYVVRLAKSDDAVFELPIILGCAIAHEIGHLLLGSNSHWAIGIMQRQWKKRTASAGNDECPSLHVRTVEGPSRGGEKANAYHAGSFTLSSPKRAMIALESKCADLIRTFLPARARRILCLLKPVCFSRVLSDFA